MLKSGHSAAVSTFLCLALAVPMVLLGPIVASAATAPTITKAALVDSNKNGHADELKLTYSTRVNHKLDTTGTYPFVVEGYSISSVAAATSSTTLLIHLAERSVSDLTVTPFVTYSGATTSDPVVSTTGTKAANQSFMGTTAVKSSAAVYVALTGNDANAGTKLAPKRTVQAGVTAAATLVPIPDVYVSAGSYSEGSGVALHTGVNVDGGYTAGTWTRSLTATTTIAGAPQAAVADGVTGVTLQLLTLSGQAVSAPAVSVYGVRAVNASSVALQWVTVTSANASAGLAGSAGLNGAPGGNATPGGTGTAGFGGTSSVGVHGGDGGAAAMGTIQGGGTGQDGSGTGAGRGGTGGNAGACNATSNTSGTDGILGQGGSAGSPGVSGPGGSSSAGAANSVWAGFVGGAGQPGAPGAGGGGGGGGGGTDYSSGFLCLSCNPMPSGGGGGGGAGGGGAGGGGGGQAGGGSFGVYLWNAAVSIDSATKVAAGGGGGGGGGQPGGIGGAAGTGSFGGGGAVSSGSCKVVKAGNGGPGGLGGGGGSGGAGGGGAGGPSIGVFRGGTSTATIQSGASIQFSTAGTGGSSPVNPGAAGIAQGIF